MMSHSETSELVFYTTPFEMVFILYINSFLNICINNSKWIVFCFAFVVLTPVTKQDEITEGWVSVVGTNRITVGEVSHHH